MRRGDVLSVAATIALALLYVGVLVVCALIPPHPWQFVGLPAGAECASGDRDGVRECVVPGRGTYLCVEDWRAHRFYCAPGWRAP
jgi:hypothetical protein